jgi:thiol:disulfide interchange protein DsbC
MIENTLLEQDNRRRRWLRAGAGLAAIIAVSAATGWGVASLAAPAAAPDTAKVREALKLRLPKTPIDAINCKGLGGLCEVASKSTLFYVDRSAKYLVIGRVYDMEARQDLTAARLLALNPDLLAAGAARRSNPETQADGSSPPRCSVCSKHPAAPCPARRPSGQRRDYLGTCQWSARRCLLGLPLRLLQETRGRA